MTCIPAIEDLPLSPEEEEEAKGSLDRKSCILEMGRKADRFEEGEEGDPEWLSSVCMFVCIGEFIMKGIKSASCRCWLCL